MPQKVWAVGEEALATDWNTYLQNQVVPQFTSTAQRDAQWVAPPKGALCVTTDTLTVWTYDGAAWQRGTSGPATWYGTVAGGTAIPSGSSLAIPVVTIPALPAGDYLITAAFGWQMNNAAPQLLGQIYRGTTATLLGVVQDARQAAYSPSALGVLTLQAVSKADAGGNVTFGISTSANVAGAATTRASTMSVQRVQAMN